VDAKQWLRRRGKDAQSEARRRRRPHLAGRLTSTTLIGCRLEGASPVDKTPSMLGEPSRGNHCRQCPKPNRACCNSTPSEDGYWRAALALSPEVLYLCSRLSPWTLSDSTTTTSRLRRTTEHNRATSPAPLSLGPLYTFTTAVRSRCPTCHHQSALRTTTGYQVMVYPAILSFDSSNTSWAQAPP
jgi:hypothetical protein